MISPTAPAPAGLLATRHTLTSTAELPASRAAELDGAFLDHGAALAISLVECAPDECGDGCGDGCTDDGPEGPAELRVAGEIDLLTVAQLRVALDQALGRARRAVVVDLRGVSFVDCAGIGALVEARWRAARRGVALQILPGRAVARTVALLDLGATLGLDAR